MSKLIPKNALVEMSQALNTMRNGYATMAEQRLFLIYLAGINARETETADLILPLNRFCEICGIENKREISKLEKITETILQKLVRVYDENGGFDNYILFDQSSIKQDEKTGEWFFKLSASKKAEFLFFNLKKFVTFRIEYALKLKSINQMRVYAFLKQEQYKKKTTIELNELREILGFNTGEYKEYMYFRRDVLEVCRKEINSLTDIQFDFKGIRGHGRGGKIVAIEFIIRSNPKKPEIIEYNADGSLNLPKMEDIQSKIKLQITPEMVEIAKNNTRWAEALEIAKNAENVTNLEHYATKIIFNWETKSPTKSPNRSPLTSQPSNSSRPQPMSEPNTKSELYVTVPPPKTREELKCEENEYWSGLTAEEKENFKKQFTDFGLEPPSFTRN